LREHHRSHIVFTTHCFHASPRTTYTHSIDAIKAALRAAIAAQTEHMPVKVKLLAPPHYVMWCAAIDKEAGIELAREGDFTSRSSHQGEEWRVGREDCGKWHCFLVSVFFFFFFFFFVGRKC
jgi:hypothetical protein